VFRRVLVLAAALCAIPARAADPDLKFEKYRLPNGLTIVLSEDHRLPQVSVNVWYHVGAANQTPGRSGFAHLFEHMMFSGSKHAKDPDAILEQIGASGMNGSTSFDRTNYYETVPSNELPTAIWLESERMGFLLPTLDEQKLKIQRDVVSNERHQRIDNVPYGPTQQRICDLLYPLPHPYYECVIGDIKEIQSASLDDVRDFFRRYYGPNNASLVLVGDFDPANAKRLIAKYFADIPRGPEVKKPDAKAKPVSSVVKETLPDRLAQLPRFQMVWNGLVPFHDDEPAGDVLSELLVGGKTSRLYQLLILEKQVASNVDATNPSPLPRPLPRLRRRRAPRTFPRRRARARSLRPRVRPPRNRDLRSTPCRRRPTRRSGPRSRPRCRGSCASTRRCRSSASCATVPACWSASCTRCRSSPSTSSSRPA